MSSLLDIMNKDMALMCNGCDEFINNKSFMKCANKRCKKLFEIECLAVQQEQFDKYTQEYKDSWVCPDCVFAHFTCVNLSSLFGVPGPNIYSVATADNPDQARTNQKGEDESKLQMEFTAFRSETMFRFDQIEKRPASLPNVLIEELCFLNKTALTDLYNKIKTVEEKVTSIENQMSCYYINHLTSRVMLLENFMGSTRNTVQKPLLEMDSKKQSYLYNNVLSVSGSRSYEQSPKTSVSGLLKPGEKGQGEDFEGAGAVEISGGEKTRRNQVRGNWRIGQSWFKKNIAENKFLNQ